ncbi:hypothetical protein CJF30_00002080 [Rutstroemia sp. NJR-2017a BBW]|nr:hypothetical protein CJF30_00002080 [Rutstroemia sp. NJR-2017a BBW]
MADLTYYIYASLILLIICLLVIIVLLIQNSVDEKRLKATPSISKQDAISTAFASIKINASADEVFNVISSFKHYGSGHAQYTWGTSSEKHPTVGSKGLYKFHLEEYQDRTIPVILTLLDRKNRKIAAKSTSYPDWLLSTERVQEVLPVVGRSGICEYRTWQTLQGVAAYYPLLTASEDLDDLVRDAARELKEFVDRRKVKNVK